MEKEHGYKRSKKHKKADSCAFAISASNCAALEEVMADERVLKFKAD